MNFKLTEDLIVRYEVFLKDVEENNYVFALKTDDGFCVSQSLSDEEKYVMPIFSKESYAKAVCKEEWETYVPTIIPLSDFKKHWLKGMQDDALLVGVNWDSNLFGLEIEPLDLLTKL